MFALIGGFIGLISKWHPHVNLKCARRRQLVYLENAAESNEGVRRSKATGAEGERRSAKSSSANLRSSMLAAASKDGVQSRGGKFALAARRAARASRIKSQKAAGNGSIDGDSGAPARKEMWLEYAKQRAALVHHWFLAFLVWIGLSRLFPTLATLAEEYKQQQQQQQQAATLTPSSSADATPPASTTPRQTPSGSISSSNSNPNSNPPLGSIPENNEASQVTKLNSEQNKNTASSPMADTSDYAGGVPPRKFSISSLRKRFAATATANGSNGTTDGTTTTETTSPTDGSFKANSFISQSISRQSAVDEPDAEDSESEEYSEAEAPAEEYEDDPQFTRIENFMMRSLSRLPPHWITRLHLHTVFRVPHSTDAEERRKQMAASFSLDDGDQLAGVAAPAAPPLGLELVAAMKRRMQRNRWWRVRLVVSFVFLVLALLTLLLVLLNLVALALLYLFSALFSSGNIAELKQQYASRPPIFGARGVGAIDPSYFQCVNGDCPAGRVPIRLHRPFGPPPT